MLDAEAILETESTIVKYVENDPMKPSESTADFVEGDCLRVDDLPPVPDVSEDSDVLSDISEDSDDSQQAPQEESDDSLRVEEDADTHRVEECDVEFESDAVDSDSVVVDHATGERISLKSLVELGTGELSEGYGSTAEKPQFSTIIDPLSGCSNTNNTSKELVADQVLDADIKETSDPVSSPATLCRGGELGVSSDDGETTLSKSSAVSSPATLCGGGRLGVSSDDGKSTLSKSSAVSSLVSLCGGEGLGVSSDDDEMTSSKSSAVSSPLYGEGGLDVSSDDGEMTSSKSLAVSSPATGGGLGVSRDGGLDVSSNDGEMTSSKSLAVSSLATGGGLGVSRDNGETTSSNASEENGSKKVATSHYVSAVASNERQIIEDHILQEDQKEAPSHTRPKRTVKYPKQWQDYLWCSDDKEGLPSYISVFHSHCGPPVQVSSGPPLAVIELHPGNLAITKIPCFERLRNQGVIQKGREKGGDTPP